ncbi:MAG TPA: SRPBCC family protein [Kofleriaceae bacterium]
MRVIIASCLVSVVAGCTAKEDRVSSSLMPVQHVSVAIDKPPAEVYAYAANPANLPRWAKGLANAPVELEGKNLIVQSPMGRVTVRFSERNTHGILDHDVTLPAGETVHNPMRVLPNAHGSEVVFSVFRRPEVDDKKFRADTDAVKRDLQALKALVEGG